MTKPIDIIDDNETKIPFHVRINAIQSKMIDMGFSNSDIHTKIAKLVESCQIRPDEYVHQYYARLAIMLDNFLQTLRGTDHRVNPNTSFKLLRGASKKELNK